MQNDLHLQIIINIFSPHLLACHRLVPTSSTTLPPIFTSTIVISWQLTTNQCLLLLVSAPRLDENNKTRRYKSISRLPRQSNLWLRGVIFYRLPSQFKKVIYINGLLNILIYFLFKISKLLSLFVFSLFNYIFTDLIDFVSYISDINFIISIYRNGNKANDEEPLDKNFINMKYLIYNIRILNEIQNALTIYSWS